MGCQGHCSLTVSGTEGNELATPLNSNFNQFQTIFYLIIIIIYRLYLSGVILRFAGF
jgi:hypothetical protein